MEVRTIVRCRRRGHRKVRAVDGCRRQHFLRLPAERAFGGDWNHDRIEIRTYPQVKCPVLAIWGARERFVPVNRSAAVFRNCMSGSGNADVTVMTIPDASHILTVPGSALDFAGDYPQVLTDWIAARFSAATDR